jgi:propionyl-CoA carboxylase alpha chain
MMAAVANDAKGASEFTVTLDDVEYPVVVDGGGKPPWKITINGRPFTVEVKEEGRVLVDGIAYDVTLEGDTARIGDESYALQVAGLSVGRVAPAAVGLAAPAKVEAGAGAVVAIMPGKVTRVMVVQGQDVQRGEAVCVLEAMKMENELRAEGGGVVKAVHVEPGDDVEKDQVLVEIEATPDDGAA